MCTYTLLSPLEWLGLAILAIILLFVLIQIILLLAKFLSGVHEHLFLKELNLAERYSPGSFVVITGASSGQGKCWAVEFAKRGFNLVLIGSRRTYGTVHEIHATCPNVKIIVIVKNFCRCFESEFFREIEEVLDHLDVSVCVNCAAFRRGFSPSHRQPEQEIRDIIACSTLLQVRMCQIAIRLFLRRKPKRSALICTGAMSVVPTMSPAISPFLTLKSLGVYESSNCFRTMHGEALHREYGHLFDIMTICPAAVVTPNTRPFLKDTFGAIECDQFVANLIRKLGQVNGIVYGSPIHAISPWLINFAPNLKDSICDATSDQICSYLMENKPKNYD